MEHVASPVRAIREIARVTRRGGWGFHLLPAPHTVIEGHLFMPFVHWLPKGPLRRNAIGLSIFLGMEPRWQGTETLTPTGKTTLYYQYSRDKPFYRSQRKIRRIRADAGFESYLVGISNPAVSRRFPFLDFEGSLRSLINWLIAEFRVIELVTQRAK